MSFYLNGFYPGDPALTTVERESETPTLEQLGEVDVLIVGSGPAGLLLAAQLSRFASLTTRVVERREGPLLLGQADGVACRTVETLNAFGISDQLLREAYWVNETTFWRPSPDHREEIVRTGRIQDTPDGMSEFPHVIVNQARMHDYLLGAMRRSARRMVPDYGVSFETLEVESAGKHPVRVQLRRGDQSFTLRARYVVGCDGARSLVRQAIGRELRGEVANHAWGVMDVLAVTDFPDFRLKCLIQSADRGSIVLIPREGGHLVRLYVDLGEVTDANREQIRGMNSTDIARAAAEVLHPYSLEVKEFVWSSVYEVAQTLTDAFDDAAGRHGDPRVFIAGDACHTHSAKAGQGMNVAIQDAFNLGWKLAAVLEERSEPSLLDTYSAERQPVADELIAFDREWSAMLATAPAGRESGAVGGEPPEIQEYFERQVRYVAGVATRYPRSDLNGPETHQHLAVGFEIGTRFHSAPVVRVADARTVQLGHCAEADGRWRLYAFSDQEEKRLSTLSLWLGENPESPLKRFTPAGADVDSVIDVRAVVQRGHGEIAFNQLPALMRPHKGRFGLLDYEKAFTVDRQPGCDIFELRSVNKELGCAVIVRPDQFVAAVFPLDGYAEIAAYFSTLLRLPAASTV